MSLVPLEIRLRPIVDGKHPSSATLSACTGAVSTPITARPKVPRTAYPAAEPDGRAVPDVRYGELLNSSMFSFCKFP